MPDSAIAVLAATADNYLTRINTHAKSGCTRLTCPELRAVVALAEYGSFVSAAAFLKTSQPALTRSIKRVEKILGVTLFARTTRQVEITAEGREFAAVAERVLKDLQITIRSLSDLSKDLRGRITFTMYSAFAVGKLPEIVRRYKEELPSVEIRIREGRQVEILEDVRSGTAEFGIGYIDLVPENLKSELLRPEPLYVVGRRVTRLPHCDASESGSKSYERRC